MKKKTLKRAITQLNEPLDYKLTAGNLFFQPRIRFNGIPIRHHQASRIPRVIKMPRITPTKKKRQQFRGERARLANYDKQ